MSKLPAVQFYPGDWRKDVGVQSLSFHDRGVWFEILMLMHESEERGVLILNGKPMSEDAMARLLGLDKQILTTTITNLLDAGVASRQPGSNALMNRRMVRDEEVRKTRSEAGKLGGNPVLLKQKPTTRVKQNPTPSSSVSTSIAKPTTTTTAVAVIELPAWIDREVWNAYLEMRKKKRAFPTERAIKGILSQLGNFRNRGHDPNAILDTSIRSNWTDVYEPKTGAGNGNQSKGDATYEALKRSIQAGRNQNAAGEIGDTPASEDGGAGVRGLLGRPDAIRDERYPGSPGVTVLTPPR